MVSAIDAAPGRFFPRLRATRRRDGQSGGGFARNGSWWRSAQVCFSKSSILSTMPYAVAREVLLGLRTTFITQFDRRHSELDHLDG